MLRIRFHGRGGQGIKTASRILGRALFLSGLEVQDAPRYGAERRGAPIFAYVRAGRAPIAERGVIHRPDLVVVADESLVALPAAGALYGLDDSSALLIRSDVRAGQWRAQLGVPGLVLTLPSQALDGNGSFQAHLAGAVCAGAAARLVGLITRPTLAEAIARELGGQREQVVTENIARTLEAFDAMAPWDGRVVPRPLPSPDAEPLPDWIELARDGVAEASPTIRALATSLGNPTGLWRTKRPVLDPERCRRCFWLCTTLCPDNAMIVEADGSLTIDYTYCKGCLLCAEQCPHHAITTVHEPVADRVAGAGRGS